MASRCAVSNSSDTQRGFVVSAWPVAENVNASAMASGAAASS